MTPMRHRVALGRPPAPHRFLPRHRPPVRHVAAMQRRPVVPVVEQLSKLPGVAAALGPALGPALAVDRVLSQAPLPLQIAAAPLFLGTGIAHAIGDVLSGPSPQEIVQRLVQQLQAQQAAAAQPPVPVSGSSMASSLASSLTSTADALHKFLGRLIP